MEVSAGTLLGGRVAYAQPAAGFRSGIEPVLLAASVPARAGEAVLEAGTGAGAGLLCLAERVPGMTGHGWELDPALAALAARNAAANGMAGLSFTAGDVTTIVPPPLYDHAFANPPYHGAGGTPSPDASRARSKNAPPGLLGDWIGAMARVLRPRGSLTLSLPAGMVPECLAGLEAAQCGSVCLLPLWPREGRRAKLVLLHALRSGRASFRVLPGLVLHAADGFTAAAGRILKDGAALEML